MVKEMVQTHVRVIRADESYGKFDIEPLERGYGTTLGNALRRVLLSSIEGAAITGVRIEGVLHEFDTIPGMKEDVLQFLLNLKNVAIRVNSLHPVGPYTLRLNVQGAGRVHAADIQCPAEIEIVNPELYLATLSDVSASMNAEIIVEIGRGFVPAIKRERGYIGLIRLNALFNPVRKVNFLVEQTLVGERTDYDRLILEVWTNGAMHPVEAVQRAATILRDQFDLLTTLGAEEMSHTGIVVSMPDSSYPIGVPDRSLEELGLSTRIINALRSAGITSLHKLLLQSREQLMQIRNFGENALKEVEEKLHEFGFELRSEGRRKKAR
ncbi:MAG: DNA-directed RNA polymerase subunit alpha [Fimbriimonadales bacterium]|nr:DNA-directed RNA polymerase subunit alpha [Fimbriimonadales bacterium]